MADGLIILNVVHNMLIQAIGVLHLQDRLENSNDDGEVLCRTFFRLVVQIRGESSEALGHYRLYDFHDNS